MIKGRIFEVFESVQGEGLYTGEKQLFVRFFGCNLNCSYCDTKLSGYMEYTPMELFAEIALHNHDDFHSISFTGGEPLLQIDFLSEMLQLTRANGYKNYLETNGTLSGELEKVIANVDIISMDIKLPSSTGMGKLWGMHQRFLKVAARKEVFVKMVICNNTEEDDLKYALELVKKNCPSAVLVLQPNSYEMNSRSEGKLEEFKAICISQGMTTCVLPQMHKDAGIR